MQDMMILINLDSPSSRSIAEKLRVSGYFCLVQPAGATPEEFLSEEVRGILLCGPAVGQPCEIPNLEKYLQTGLPILALGDAALSLCCSLDGTLSADTDMAGSVPVHFDPEDPLLAGVKDSDRYLPAARWLSLSPQIRGVASSAGRVLGFRMAERPVYGFAFQIESNDPDGMQLLNRFGAEICRCEPWWSDRALIDRAVEEIRLAAEDGMGVCAISGGVDSAVCAKLGSLALGERMHCLFVDTGLLREGEAEDVMENLGRIAGLQVTRVEARGEFIQALENVSDAGEKQRIVYALLRAHLRHWVSQHPDVRVILQGTNYSDTFGKNVSLDTELPSARVRLLEPLRCLFKDEIRQIGEILGLPESICRRQPFPSSGLALRIIPMVTEERLRQLGTADRILREEIEGGGYNKRLWQYYAMLYEDSLPEDGGLMVILRAIQAQERGAVAARLPADLTERITQRILREIPEVRRVLYDLTPSKTYGQMEWA